MFIHDNESQTFYDSYNEFIFAKDLKILQKLLFKYNTLSQTRDVPGDIIELGVFKGSGMVGWLKILKILGMNNKKVLGFDIFDQDTLVKNINTSDSEVMRSLFAERNFDAENYDIYLNEVLTMVGFSNFSIIKGDVFDTVPKFLEHNPGFRASVINFDLDTDEPTYKCMDLLWDRLVPGGVMVFDEYAVNEWTESNAVDRFIAQKRVRLLNTNLIAPTAYIVKEF
ncbi:MAG: TylF/MycF family methyltransferase [Rickettsiaceae bacterium]|nr:TylF/MycF family methyltransferase [Rickettsiaceae bacterium]